MKILRVEAEDFGCLSGCIEFCPDGINLWIAPNEQGKSSLAAAICEALYGPPRPLGQRRGHQRLAALRPLNEGAFRVQLDVDVNGRHITILRDFADGRVQVLEGGIHGTDITEEFRARGGEFEIGERLLGLTQGEFEKSVFASQGEMDRVREAEDLTRVLQRIADAQGGDRTVAEAIELLEEQEQEYPLSTMGARGRRVRLSTEKTRLQQRIDELSSQIEQKEALRRSIAEKEQKLSQLEMELGEQRSEREHLAHLVCKAELREIEERLRSEEDQREQVSQLEVELEELSAYATFPLVQQQNLHRWLDEIERLNEELLDLQKDLADKNREIDEHEGRIRRLGVIAEFTQQDRDDLLRLVERLQEAEKAMLQARKQLDQEHRRLETEGRTLERYEELLQAFDGLSLEERRVLRQAVRAHRERQAQRTQASMKRDSANNTLERIEKDRARWKRLAKALLLGGFLALGSSFLMMGWHLVAGISVLVVSALTMLAGAASWQTSKSRYADEYARAELERQQACEALRQLEQDEEKEQQHLEKLGQKLGLQTEEKVLSEFEELEALTQETEGFRRLHERHAEKEETLNQLRKDAGSWLERAALPSAEVSSCRLEMLLAEVDRALKLHSELETARQQRKDIEEKVRYKERRLHETAQAVEKLLSEVGLDQDLRGEEAREAFDEAAKKAQRYQQIQSEMLPRERGRLLSTEEIQQLESRKEELEREISQAESAESGEKLSMLDPEADRITYQRRRDELSRRIEETQQQIYGLESEISEVLRESRDIASLHQQRDELKSRLKRAERFEAALAVAKETLQRLATEVHEIWADHLNEFASQAFAALLPHYQDPRFDHDLHFTFVHPEHPGRIDPASRRGRPPRLSGGTIEQIYFIVRAAIADFLACSSTRPPLILDEPFPHSHDERFLKGMQFLAEHLAKDRQIIIFSCHEVRHQWMLEQAPELRECIHPVAFKGTFTENASQSDRTEQEA
jgi:uncharacterized protein YhaN